MFGCDWSSDVCSSDLHGLGHIFDFVSCIPDVAYAPMSNFSCHCLIEGVLTNQIALLLPVRGRTEFGKMFGIKGRWFLSSPPLSPSYSPPLYLSLIFWLTPGVLLRSPAFRSLVRSPRRLKHERNRLLRRLFQLLRFISERKKPHIARAIENTLHLLL